MIQLKISNIHYKMRFTGDELSQFNSPAIWISCTKNPSQSLASQIPRFRLKRQNILGRVHGLEVVPIVRPEDAIWEQDDHGHEKDGDNASGGEHGGDPKEHDEVDPAHDSEPQRLKEQRMTPQVKRRANHSTSRLNLV